MATASEAAPAVVNGKAKTNGVAHGLTNGLSHFDSQATTAVPGASSPESSTVRFDEPGRDRGDSESSAATDQHPRQSRRIQSFGVHEEEAGGPRSRAHAKIRTWGGNAHEADFPRLSKPVELLRNSYDCVVIGSGYGGGVAASRMARAGESVCVLERGKERWPGEYPSSTEDALELVHYSGEFAPGWLPKKIVDGGDPTGMFHMVFGNGQNAIVGNGLGGTSLINANVFLEADKDTLSLNAWPEEIRKDPDSLKDYYLKAEKVLQPEKYPTDWPELPKLKTLEKQAENLNMRNKFHRVRQTTRFRNGPNSCGVEMNPSALTGQDPTGINDGSKNTTLVTYIADAWNWGAEIFCESEVRYITKAPMERGGGYLIYFAWHGRNRGHFKSNLHGDLMFIHAKKAVFLGAGAIGTTEILLRSKEMGLKMSRQIGQNMSGNGDILAFGYNTDNEVNAIGRSFPSPYHPIGPCITGIIDNRDGHDNPLDGYVIEEGTVPKALAPFLQAMLELLPGSIKPKGDGLVETVKSNLARAGSALLGPYYRRGAIERTQVFLIMSHDSNQAILTLKENKPVLEFIGVGRSDHVKELHKVLEKATESVGGTFVPSPFYSLMGQQEVTVHPIGGACMARDGTGYTGVTNHCGEVFTGEGKETYPGLIVTDAAVIPTALGANPFATITALAERSVEHYAKRKGLEISTRPNGILDLFGAPKYARRRSSYYVDVKEREELESISNAHEMINTSKLMNDSGFGFTEVMSGHIHSGEGLTRDSVETYEIAERTAKALCETARFFLSVQSWNTREIINEPNHHAMLTGTFACPTIEGSPFMVHRGDFSLFRLDHKAPGTRNFMYDFNMTGTNGRVLHFHGYKVVDSSVALSPFQFWRATTTLYVTISEPVSEEDSDPEADEVGLLGKVVAKGVLHIHPTDFMSQIMTMGPTGSSLLKQANSAVSFFNFFVRKSMSLFLAPFIPLQYPSQTYEGYINETLPSNTYEIYAEDRVCTRMHVWEPTNPNIETKNLFMIPGASVDHQIYALPTIKYNAVNYFTRAGYRVFITVHRIGELMVAQNKWTTFDARLDIKACLEVIRKDYDKKPIYTIAHCMGSVAFSTGLLDGTIPASWILGVTCSQVFMNPIWNSMNMIKIMAAPIPLDLAYRTLAGPWFSCSTGKDDSLLQKGLNELLRFWPDERKELCNSASCHRATLVFGRCWNHRNLNEATHRQIDRFFGGVNMTLLHLLMKQGYDGGVMTNGPLFQRIDKPSNIQRLKGIPFLLFVGRDNAVLSPEATEKTYEILCDTFGTRANNGAEGMQYRRRVVPDYGHLDCWMGRNAWKDVYPFVREEVDRVVRGEDYRFHEPHDKFKRMVDEGSLLY